MVSFHLNTTKWYFKRPSTNTSLPMPPYEWYYLKNYKQYLSYFLDISPFSSMVTDLFTSHLWNQNEKYPIFLLYSSENSQHLIGNLFFTSLRRKLITTDSQIIHIVDTARWLKLKVKWIAEKMDLMLLIIYKF